MSSFALHSLFARSERRESQHPRRSALRAEDVMRADAFYGRFSPAFYTWVIGLIEGRVPPPAND